ncbi:MAG: hypothetical protein A2350_14075 [Candidatus Raymondbacteria bacterium RifOxyB12_full_50_8]|uniref:HTH araC/xylS-type domain-containing protein n=1 Tax=Candidatus Raymondbacteria bacterium RIFOXYD12_FULL_49_13 TaxID=1817890 RepID=A0A1F7FIA4_UNCRA|nr:MAG: hypothetical protein A2248_21425 [Candidatus Raymondbacteria bacterium RIFOXYA2_FULL_49_16]OGJ98667.1 MAG: hypothetical protein A2350_14075 [Candidatus Raymondbacteria bacterium RifOxyB12_full_50_8]OGK06348.1 MAG: hypothetical protein A2519_08745 [Candidatus Raymondbacteria bacterium RIFOXYD12_FULL_49_13]
MPFSIDVLVCRSQTLSDWHYTLCDPFWRIYWMDRKGWYVRYQGKPLALDPTYLAVIPANTPCYSESRARATQFHVHFKLDSAINPFKPGVYFLPITKTISGLISGLMDPARIDLENIIMKTLHIKNLCYDCLSRLPKESLDTCAYSPRITFIMETIVQNLKDPPSNKMLAQSIGMNTNSFIRLFHQETGTSPQKWCMKARINQAALLLSHSTKTIEDIAEETAFFDRNHFSRVFKQFKDIGPAAYRKQSENK